MALVTGATGGIGAATVSILSECGANVAATSRSKSLIKETSSIFPIEANFSYEKDAKHAIEQTLDRFGKIDYVAHCAGAVGSGRLDQTSLKDWNRLLEINLTSTFLLCKEIYQPLKKTKGSLVLISSVNGTHGGSEVSGIAYATSKAGINNITRYLAKEWAKDQIRVNCVSPGPVDTPMLDRLTAEQHAYAKASTLLGKYSTAEECAGLIAFLFSPWSASITGTIKNISAGIVLD